MTVNSMTVPTFDPSRLHKQPGLFERFDVLDEGVPVGDTKLPGAAELIVFERHRC